MKLKAYLTLYALAGLLLTASFTATAQPSSSSTDNPVDGLQKPLYKPFIERYILDDLKQLRQEQMLLKAEMAEKVAAAQLSASDRAIRYTADTTNNIFYIITMAASLMVLMGWKSLRDVRDNIESVTSNKLAELTQEYEKRLNNMEQKIKLRSEQIIATQEDISNTNMIHSLWMRAGIEKSEQEKIRIYDQILDIKHDDIEALTYKADALLDVGETKWALSLAEQAIEQDEGYALAYWQKACAKAVLGDYDEALRNIEIAINLSESLKDGIASEKYFETMQGHEGLRALMTQKEES